MNPLMMLVEAVERTMFGILETLLEASDVNR